MKKRVFFVLVLALVMAGGVFALDLGNNGMALNLPSNFGYNSGVKVDLFADGSSAPRLTSSPLLAGFLNMPFGLWSWMNGDYLGGGITAGAMVGGIVLMVVGATSDTKINPESPVAGADNLGKMLAGLALLCGGSVFGGVWGFFECRSMNNASGLAEAMSDNPLNHISLVALPTFDERTVQGSLTYSVAF